MVSDSKLLHILFALTAAGGGLVGVLEYYNSITENSSQMEYMCNDLPYNPEPPLGGLYNEKERVCLKKEERYD